MTFGFPPGWGFLTFFCFVSFGAIWVDFVCLRSCDGDIVFVWILRLLGVVLVLDVEVSYRDDEILEGVFYSLVCFLVNFHWSWLLALSYSLFISTAELGNIINLLDLFPLISTPALDDCISHPLERIVPSYDMSKDKEV